jgi:hypothetical protein
VAVAVSGAAAVRVIPSGVACGRVAVWWPIGTVDLLAKYLFTAGRLELGKLAGEVLGAGREAGGAVNHVRIVHQKSAIVSAPSNVEKDSGISQGASGISARFFQAK